MLTLAIFDCNADELIIDPALRAKWHIDLISAHDVIDNGISAGIIAAFVKADKLNDCFNDKFSFYIYFQGELKTLDDWIRETDLSGSFYFGGTLDYHF